MTGHIGFSLLVDEDQVICNFESEHKEKSTPAWEMGPCETMFWLDCLQNEEREGILLILFEGMACFLCEVCFGFLHGFYLNMKIKPQKFFNLILPSPVLSLPPIGWLAYLTSERSATNFNDISVLNLSDL